jgi:hypothetical protein
MKWGRIITVTQLKWHGGHACYPPLVHNLAPPSIGQHDE